MEEKNKKINPVLIEGIVLCALSVLGIIFSIICHYGFKVEWKLSPYLFPLFISIMLCMLSISLILSSFSGLKELKYLGFLISTMLLLGAIVHLLGEKSWWKIILISVVTSLIIYFLFGVYLGVMLPKGKLLYMIGIRL